MRVAFEGTGQLVVTFETEGEVMLGTPVVMGDNHTVKTAGKDEAPIGFVQHERQGFAAIQLQGFVDCPFTGTAPTVGWNKLSADGQGGCQLDEQGLSRLVVWVKDDRFGFYL